MYAIPPPLVDPDAAEEDEPQGPPARLRIPENRHARMQQNGLAVAARSEQVPRPGIGRARNTNSNRPEPYNPAGAVPRHQPLFDETSNGGFAHLDNYRGVVNEPQSEEDPNSHSPPQPENEQEIDEHQDLGREAPPHHEPIFRLPPAEMETLFKDGCFNCDFEDLALPQEIMPIVEEIAKDAYQRLLFSSPNRVAMWMERALKTVLVKQLADLGIDLERHYGIKLPNWRQIAHHLTSHGQNAIIDYVILYRMTRQLLMHLYQRSCYEIENEDHENEDGDQVIPQIDTKLIHEYHMMLPKFFAVMNFNPTKSILVPTQASAAAANQSPVIAAASSTMIGMLPKFVNMEQAKQHHSDDPQKLRKPASRPLPGFLQKFSKDLYTKKK